MKAALVVVLLILLGQSARAEDCTKAYQLRGGKWIDPETGVVVPPCDGDALPTPDVLWYIQREGRATEADSELTLVRAELIAERDLHKTDVDRLTAEVQAERDARLACERERAPAPPPRAPFYSSPWFGGAVGAVVGAGVVLAAALLTR